jgi:hypothetical protein
MILASIALVAAIASYGAVREPSPAAATSLRVQETEEKDCKKCENTGRVVCPEHTRAECELELELGLVYCSVLIDCAACGGTGLVVCPDCKSEPAATELADRRSHLAARKIALKSFDDTMKRPLRKAESPHFVLIWEMDRLKVNKKHLGAHELLHVYLKRLERLFADSCATLGVPDQEFENKFEVFVWQFPQDQLDGSTRFCGQGGEGPMKLMGRKPRFSVLGSKKYFQDDEKLHRNVVHSVTHLMLSAQQPSAWIGNLKCGWADEGLAHWFEEKYWGVCDNYCFQEQDANVDFKGGKFKLALRKMASMDETPPISEVLQHNTDTLTLPMHAASFGYVDYLISRDSAKFNQLLKKLRERVVTRDALQQVFGMTPLEMETQWKAWILATYPTR